ncbi:ion transporter [Chloroflexi bacterium TSY]|nr:ion transporter [Chloroflexi bacterium TSY]
MTTILNSDRPRIIKILIGEPTVVSIIFLNSVALFLDAFPNLHAQFGDTLEAIDYACIVYFVFEAMLKIGVLSFRVYWQSYWNKFLDSCEMKVFQF